MNAIQSKLLSFGRGLKSQWLATALIFPMAILGVNAYVANEAAKDARVQSARIERIVRIQESGKTLDLALASYFQSVSEVGLAERNLRMPGTYENTPVATARATVVEAREEAREALVKHASDVQALRGTLDQAEAENYMAALAEMGTTVERDADIDRTGESITVLGKLVVARNDLVDDAMGHVG